MSALRGPALRPMRSSKPAADINGFFQIVGQALQNYIETEGVPLGTSPTYEETFPRERLSRPDTPFDIVLFSVIEGVMSPTSNDGATVPRAPSGRQVEAKRDEGGYNQVTQGWWETYTVCFEIWSKSNSVANQMAVWFQRFLIRYAYYYKFFDAFGIQQLRFVKRGQDRTDTSQNQELYVRPLHYSVRLEFLDTFTERQITDLTLNVQINRDVLTYEFPTRAS